MVPGAQFCRVCGYDSSDLLPWGRDGRTATFELCPCCGVEWGYEDATPAAVARFRERWLADGGEWVEPVVPHDRLTTERRLARVPEEFR